MGASTEDAAASATDRGGAMPRRRTLWFHAVTAAVTLAGCLAVAGAYFVVQGMRLPRIPVRFTGDWLIARDDEIGFVPTRNGSTELRYLETGLQFHLFTDRRGARVDTPGEQTPDHVDVMTVGCSFTWGTGVESEETYTRQLGRLLGVPVANFGMGSYGSVQSFQTIVRNADLKPKVVVYGFIREHLRRNVSPCAPNYVPLCMPVSYLERQGDWIVLQPPHMEYFAPEENRAFLTELSMREPGPFTWLVAATWAAKLAWFHARAPDPVAVDDSPETMTAGMRAMIGAMADEAHAVGATLVVLNMPYLQRGRVEGPPDALVRAMEGRDVMFVDVSPVAAAYYASHPTGTLTLDRDPHPSATAHRLIAETLAEAVRPLLAR